MQRRIRKTRKKESMKRMSNQPMPWEEEEERGIQPVQPPAPPQPIPPQPMPPQPEPPQPAPPQPAPPQPMPPQPVYVPLSVAVSSGKVLELNQYVKLDLPNFELNLSDGTKILQKMSYEQKLDFKNAQGIEAKLALASRVFPEIQPVPPNGNKEIIQLNMGAVQEDSKLVLFPRIATWFRGDLEQNGVNDNYTSLGIIADGTYSANKIKNLEVVQTKNEEEKRKVLAICERIQLLRKIKEDIRSSHATQAYTNYTYFFAQEKNRIDKLVTTLEKDKKTVEKLLANGSLGKEEIEQNFAMLSVVLGEKDAKKKEKFKRAPDHVLVNPDMYTDEMMRAIGDMLDEVVLQLKQMSGQQVPQREAEIDLRRFQLSGRSYEESIAIIKDAWARDRFPNTNAEQYIRAAGKVVLNMLKAARETKRNAALKASAEKSWVQAFVLKKRQQRFQYYNQIINKHSVDKERITKEIEEYEAKCQDKEVEVLWQVSKEKDPIYEAYMGTWKENADELRGLIERVRPVMRANIDQKKQTRFRSRTNSLQDTKAKQALDIVTEYFPVDWVNDSDTTWGTFEVGEVDRGGFSPGEKKIGMSGLSQASSAELGDRAIQTAFHEYTHTVEAPRLARYEALFFDRRAKGNIQKMGIGIPPQELRSESGFAGPYVGKIYETTMLRDIMDAQGKDPANHSTYEILSVGMEAVFTDPVWLWEKDPDYAAFIYGCLVLA